MGAFLYVYYPSALKKKKKKIRVRRGFLTEGTKMETERDTLGQTEADRDRQGPA